MIVIINKASCPMLARRCGQHLLAEGGELLQKCFYEDLTTGVKLIREVSFEKFVELEEKGPQSLFLIVKSSLFMYAVNGNKVPYACRRHGKGAHGFYRKGKIQHDKGVEPSHYDTHTKLKKCIVNALQECSSIQLNFLDEYGIKTQVSCEIDHIDLYPVVSLNGQCYQPDSRIVLRRTKPSYYFRKWNGSIYLEVNTGHDVPIQKSMEFCRFNLPLFEMEIPCHILNMPVDDTEYLSARLYSAIKYEGCVVKMHWQPLHLPFRMSRRGNWYARIDGECYTIFENRYKQGTYGVWSRLTGYSYLFANQQIESLDDAKRYASFLAVRTRMERIITR